MIIAEAVARIRERMENACVRAGRDSREVRLCAASKFHKGNAVLEAYAGGVRCFGESRVQEAMEKFAGFKEKYPNAEVHFIGNLQRNKVKDALALFDCVQSVDRLALLDELGVLTQNRPIPLPVLLEMHTAEDSKAGFPDADALCFAAEKTLSYPGLALSGLMTIAPFTNEEKMIRASFKTLVSAQVFLESRFPGRWNCLSMGMSNDFETAIEEGSTLIRIGTALFGERNV